MAFLATVLLWAAIFLVLRLLYLLVAVRWSQGRSGQPPRKDRPVRTMIVMGSGGHTAEMLQIASRLETARYHPRHYVMALSDPNSVIRVIESEIDREPDTSKHTYGIVTITRCREVHQTYWSAICTTLQALANCVPVVLKFRPELILTNGPGTCVPICVVAFLARLLFLNASCRIVFIESFCRVRSLSLSGRILLWIVDMFVVQWPELAKQDTPNGREVHCFGRLS